MTQEQTTAGQTREGLQRWDPAHYAGHDPDGLAGMCHFAPNCGGGLEYGKPDKETGLRKVTRPSSATCPSAPAEFSSRTGMLREGAGFERFVPICRYRAEREFGEVEVRRVEREG